MVEKDIPKEVIDLKNKGIKIIKLTSEEYGDFYLRKPNKEELKLLFSKIAKDRNSMVNVMESFVREWIVYPARQEFEKILENKPGIFLPMFDELTKRMGLDANFESEEI